MSVPCNIELGHYRFVQTTEWNGEPRIDVREWETRRKKDSNKKRNIIETTKMESSGRGFGLFGQVFGRENKLVLTHRWKRVCKCKNRQRLC